MGDQLLDEVSLVWRGVLLTKMPGLPREPRASIASPARLAPPPPLGDAEERCTPRGDVQRCLAPQGPRSHCTVAGDTGCVADIDCKISVFRPASSMSHSECARTLS